MDFTVKISCFLWFVSEAKGSNCAKRLFQVEGAQVFRSSVGVLGQCEVLGVAAENLFFLVCGRNEQQHSRWGRLFCLGK